MNCDDLNYYYSQDEAETVADIYCDPTHSFVARECECGGFHLHSEEGDRYTGYLDEFLVEVI